MHIAVHSSADDASSFRIVLVPSPLEQLQTKPSPPQIHVSSLLLRIDPIFFHNKKFLINLLTYRLFEYSFLIVLFQFPLRYYKCVLLVICPKNIHRHIFVNFQNIITGCDFQKKSIILPPKIIKH